MVFARLARMSEGISEGPHEVDGMMVNCGRHEGERIRCEMVSMAGAVCGPITAPPPLILRRRPSM